MNEKNLRDMSNIGGYIVYIGTSLKLIAELELFTMYLSIVWSKIFKEFIIHLF